MGSGGKLHSFLKSAIQVAELSASRSGHVFPVEETPSTGLAGSWTVPRDVLDALEENFLAPARNRAKGFQS
jgi:hypothetical protein